MIAQIDPIAGIYVYKCKHSTTGLRIVPGTGMFAATQNPLNSTNGEAVAPKDFRSARAALAVAAGLAVGLIATHWTTFGRMSDRWTNDPQYSHGFIVPLFALAVLWSRREMLKRLTWEPAWLGLGLLVLGAALRIVAYGFDIEPLDSLSLLPTVFGLVLLIGGWSVLSWAWPALGFLAFMMPLPFSLETALAQPLRGVATAVSTYALQTLGCPAMAEGNIIYLDDIGMGVAEACSGLGMLMTFFALATALAMIVKAPLRDRLILIASAVPIAIGANVVRITATGVAYHLAGRDSSLAQMIYHDLAGWLMMPIAMMMLWVELKFLANLIIEESDAKPLLIGSLSLGPRRLA